MDDTTRETIGGLLAVAVFVGAIALFFAAVHDAARYQELCVDSTGERYHRGVRTDPLTDSHGFRLKEEPAGLRCKTVRKRP